MRFGGRREEGADSLAQRKGPQPNPPLHLPPLPLQNISRPHPHLRPHKNLFLKPRELLKELVGDGMVVAPLELNREIS